MGPLFDYAEGQAAKDTGMAQVLENTGPKFVDQAAALVHKVHAGQTILAEQWRQTCIEHGVTPHHPNAWGALTSSLSKRGIIRGTGRYTTATSKKNNGHKYQLWDVLIWPSTTAS